MKRCLVIGAVLLSGALGAGCKGGPGPEDVGAAQSALGIQGLYTTGVDDTRAVLPIGSVDPHFVLTSTDPSFPGPNAVAVNPAGGWVGNSARAEWISIQTSLIAPIAATYTYTETFDIPAFEDPSTASLGVKWTCADSCTMMLNGTPIATANSPSATVTTNVPMGSPFVNGPNALSFVVTSSAGNPTGLLVASISGSDNAPAPCLTDSQCLASQFCDTSVNVCTPKLANGTPVPTIGNHAPPLTGTCNAAVGAAVCVSGVCDTGDNKCGYANGDGPCTMGNGSLVCRSGMCGAGNVCTAGGCVTDADCSGGQWCDESTATCTAKLPNGTAIPNDPPHTSPTLNGTCTAAAALLVCASGVCDVNDNKCGFANGDGPCTAVNGGTVCRSGACSVDLLCEPAGGCNVDADCAAGNWCDESTHTCTAKLANGTAIPNDPPHTSPTLNGMCTAGAGVLVCVSGVCDPNDNKCGFANGDGPCTAVNGGTVCRSGVCSVSLVCEPAGGCDVDADCAGGNWCDESTHTCTAKLANGTPIPTDPPHTSPTLDGTCTAGAAALVCTSGVCDPNDNKCGFANGDGPCMPANGSVVCRSGACSVDLLCEPAGGCNVDGDCAGSDWCDESTHTCTPKLANGAPVPNDPPHTSPTLNGTCTAPAATLVCASGVCDPADNLCGLANGDGPCTPATGGVVCRSGACSVSGVCEPAGSCDVDADCAGGKWCDESTHTCTAKIPNGGALPNDPPHTSPTLNGMCTAAAALLVCVSGVCDVDNACGLANGDGPCTAGNGGVVCRSGMCGAGGVCQGAGGCNTDADCSGGNWCDESTHTCTAKLPNGTALPNDPPHTSPTLNGMCTAAAAMLVCQSGVCDTDDLCGLANGDGPCMPATGGVVCRSGACSVDLTCEPAGGCNVDADCASGNWCKEQSHTCTGKLANGVAVPSDPPHTSPTLNGTCTAAAATLVCQSAVCDAADNACGYADGDGPCNMMNGPTVCRSGVCNAGGTCGPSVGCSVDTDCSAGFWCNESSHTCAPQIVNGGAVPSDPAHSSPTLNGTCTAPAGALTCVSGVCDVHDNDCGFANGDGPCTGANGPTVCRSTLCATTGPNQGTCVACTMDSQCSGATPVCSGTTNACVQCTAAEASACMGTKPVCDAASSSCVPCDGDFGASSSHPCPQGSAPLCFTSGAAAGSCGKCATNADCAGDAAGPVCNATTGACGPGCAQDSDCGGPMSGQVCNGTTSMCEPGCRGTGGNGCPTPMSCTSTDNTIGMCVGCVTDANCGSQMSGQVCNGATGMCEPGCRGKDGNGCPTGETCSSKNQMIGMCQQCTTDATCGGPKSGLVCDGATGMCEPGCRGKDGNGCPTNEVCSSTDGSIGTCMNGAGGGGAGPSDGITASGNGLLCAAAPGRDGGDTGWLVGGLLGVLAAARRRRRAQRAAP